MTEPYENLAEDIAALIRQGVMGAGDRIPSVRQASQHHRLSISTVIRTYLLLESRGLIEARPQSVHGQLSPCVFLAIAQRANLMGTLTVEALRLALADWRQWQCGGLTLPVSLNLSAGLLSDPCLATQLIGMVAAAGMPSRCLTFEITEDTEMTDLGAALRVLVKLRLAGFGLSLDDDGVGFSSMLRLSRIPFTELKIDRSLVHNAWARPHLLPFLRSAIGLARDLGVQAVAEGIETVEDLQLLQQLGCDQVQGYHLARPMPAQALLRWRGSGRGHPE